ncbi:MAG: ABC transporter substrate-binding protein, partial [Chloroflexi bacterium]|nr:ABC transporter substrate-binding protein [Chloroflexota bacterium]
GSRRDLLGICAKLGLSAAVAGPILAACGGGAATPAATETSGAGATGTATSAATETGTAAATGTATAAAATGALTERQKTLVTAYQADGATIDPAIYWECQETDVVGAMYDNMVATKWNRADDSIEIVPQLAESWDIAPDNMSITLHLRKGVTFHDGEPYNAEAQRYSWERQVGINQNTVYMIKDYVDKYEAMDEYTFKVTLKKPMATYIQYLAGFWCPSRPVSKKAVEANKTADDPWATKWFRGNGVGTGPYKFVSWTPNQQYELAKFENYWQGWDGNHMDKLVHRIVGEVTTQRMLLEKGDIDVIMQPLPPQDFKALEGKPGIVTVKSPSIFLTNIQMNHTKAPTNDINYRMGLVYAFDYDAAVNNIYGGLAIRNGQTMDQGMEGYRTDIELPKKDLAKAKEYFDKANYKDPVEMIYGEGDDIIRRIAEMFQADLASIGITLNIRPVSTSVWWDMEAKPETAAQLNLCYWGPDNRDPSSIVYILWHTGGLSNFGYFSNPRVDEILDKVQQEPDKAKRSAIYAEVDDIVRADAGWIMICQQVDGNAYRSDLKNLEPAPVREWSPVVYDVYRQV